MATDPTLPTFELKLDIQRVLFRLDPDSPVYGCQLSYPSDASRAFEPIVYEQIVRVPQLNTPGFSGAHTKRNLNLVSFLIHATGQEVSVPCNSRTGTCGAAGDGGSKYLGCVMTTNQTVRAKVKGACGNHMHNCSNSRCSFNATCHQDYGPYLASAMQPLIYDAADRCPSAVLDAGGPVPFHERARRFSPQYRSFYVAIQSLSLDKLWEFHRGPEERKSDFRQMGVGGGRGIVAMIKDVNVTGFGATMHRQKFPRGPRIPMRRKGLLPLFGLALVRALSPVAKPILHSTLLERGDQLRTEYGYIVVGGGTAGLTVADRLTEREGHFPRPSPGRVRRQQDRAANHRLGQLRRLPLPTRHRPPTFLSIAARYEAQDLAAYPPAHSDPTLVAGYRAQQRALAAAFRSNGSAVYIMLLRGAPNEGAVVSLRPLSRGTVSINAMDPYFGEVAVDYLALSNPADVDVLVEFTWFTRRLFAQTALSGYDPVERAPGREVATREGIEAWLRSGLNPSVFHHVGTAAMVPRALGGVVDEGLRVYGVQALSVVDASVMPDLPGAYTQQTVYAVAEKVSSLPLSRAAQNTQKRHG
ncbi:GMC oxidoreductase-domain-containing protein [Lasiosphaeris hirsuta]|uniref:GMC oxidoreductase-domain-containing protein n=1 Tax=Lasiosphaeris hirsuta TaxID=260670 RepID=A0AA40DLF3_9PEZI|nr:GMC oxidoreductase-domain-containing protein [Lasiosphaeris hirsuta]